MTKPTRILHVIGIMNRGGAEAMIMNLYRSIDRSKVQFDFVQNAGQTAAYDPEIESLGGKIYHCPRYRGKNHIAYTQWWHAFFREHPEEYPIVHGHIGSTAAIYLGIAKKYGSYAIAHSHNTQTQFGISDILYAAYAFPTRFVADCLFACSKAAAISRYGRSKGNAAHVLNNAIDVEKYSYDLQMRKSMREAMGLSDNFVIGHVGRFAEQKNHLFLLKVFEQVLSLCPHARLLLVGDGELRSQIEQFIREKKLTEHVLLAGVQPNVNEYLQAMDIFVMPSLYEGLPVSMVEAQAAGLPCVISTNVPAETDITGNVDFVSLEVSPEIWAKKILEKTDFLRENMMPVIQSAGYDIRTTARWLENFYLDLVK